MRVAAASAPQKEAMPVATQMSRFLPPVIRTPSQVVNTLVPRSCNWIAWCSPPVGPIRDAIIQMTASQQPYTPSPVHSVPATIAGSGTCVDRFRDESLKGTFVLLPLVHTISVESARAACPIDPSIASSQTPLGRPPFSAAIAPSHCVALTGLLTHFGGLRSQGYGSPSPWALESRPFRAQSQFRLTGAQRPLACRKSPECRHRAVTLRVSPIRRPVVFMALKGNAVKDFRLRFCVPVH